MAENTLAENIDEAIDLVTTMRALIERTATDVVLPKGLTTIGHNAFYNSDIHRINMYEGITSIGIAAFQYCSTLIGIDLPDSIQQIGNFAFDYCNHTSFTRIYFSKQLQSIGTWAFKNTNISNVYYEGSEDEWRNVQIGQLAFNDWYGYPYEPHGFRIAVHYNSTRDEFNSIA